MKCIISYMARKMWDGFVETLPGFGIGIIITATVIAVVYAVKAICEWLGIEPQLFIVLCLLPVFFGVVIHGFINLYRAAKRHCDKLDG